jgi:hypothetical protein
MKRKTKLKILVSSFIMLSFSLLVFATPQGDCRPSAPFFGFGTGCCKYTEMFGSQFTIVEKCCGYAFWINTGCERSQTLDLPGGNGPIPPSSTVEP